MDRTPLIYKREEVIFMTASLQTKKDRPNYFVVLAYKDIATGKNKTKWISTDIPIKGNNKRLANEK